MAESGRDLWRRTARFTLVAFAVLSLMPVWPAWYFGSWEATGELASFWTMLASLPRAVEQRGASQLIFDFYGPGLALPAVLLGASLLVGRWLAGRSRGKPVALNRGTARLLALGLFLLAAALLATLGR